MRGILADANIKRAVNRLANALQAEPYREFWEDMGLAYFTFEDFGLQADAADSRIWRLCQEQGLVLITDNRNHDMDSIQTMIRTENTLNSLPVFTISDIDRFQNDGEYADRVLDRLATMLLTIDSYMGAGRVYLP